jgi:ferredoxin
LLLAGGSGITPILSIVKTALTASPSAQITLYYAARRPAEMAYRRELLTLAEAHPALIVRLFFDAMPSDEREVSRDMDGGANARSTPRITEGRIGALDFEPLRGLVDEVFLCGPEPMMDGLEGMLRALDVPAEAIHRELFFTPRSAPLPARKEPVHLTVFGRQLLADPRRTLLESALAAKLAVPYSCTMGGCGECRAQLTEGHVSMAEPNCLSHRERAEGAVLPCISYPLDDVRLDYPDSDTNNVPTAPPGEESPR